MVLFACAVIALGSCEKNKDKDFLFQNEWKVKSISIDNRSLKPSSKTFREEAYILKFINDTCFIMNTSVNYANWKYQIVSEGHIFISFQNSTRVCCENDFDEQLLNILNDVNRYSCKGNKLFFSTEKNREIVFGKR